ncbi:uncharacterized protein LOC132054280 [Lycium ferocissimum]|uniref:uncharacterized protein LOC132054280 n=1 Tax=Lycium ferocissimum TaxID=112874 RepID=UPI002815F0C0|nr:uncharacterized protein LOC132054280 [Lycium ferocissimum]
MDDRVQEAEYQAMPGRGRGTARGGGGAARGRRAARGRGARRGRSAAARGPGGGGHHLVDEADEAAPIPEAVPVLVHPQPFQASASSPGQSPRFTSALLLIEIPGCSSQPSQNAYIEERDDVDWAALRAPLADERPLRNLDGPRILDFDDFLIPDSALVGSQERPTQAFSHGPAEPTVSSHVTVEPQDSAPVGPQQRPIQDPTELQVSSQETIEQRETTSYSAPDPSQEPTDPPQKPTQAPVDTQTHPSAPAMETPDEEEVEFPDPDQPKVLTVPAGLDPKKKHVIVKGEGKRR